MTNTETPSPVEVLTDIINESRWDLVQEITRLGERVGRAVVGWEQVVANAHRAVESGERPMGGHLPPEDPIQLLRDMEPLIKVARGIGVPDTCIAQARRGEFVNVSDYICMCNDRDGE